MTTFRYRAYNLFQATERSDTWSSVYFFRREIRTILALVPKASLIVLVRLRWRHDTDEILLEASRRQVRVLFDIDDLVFDINQIKLVTNTLNVSFDEQAAYDRWFAEISRLQYTASKAGGFITSTDFLGERLAKKFNRPYKVIPNGINREQRAISKTYSEKKLRKKPSKPFVIGYFSGTPTHVNDFGVISHELLHLLARYEDTELLVVGYMDFPREFLPLIDKKRVRLLPPVNFLQLQRLIAGVDVNVIPLVENAFTSSKSELKFFEAALVHTLSIASPLPVYKKHIQSGVNGFLARPGQWYPTLERIYLGEVDAVTMAKEAHQYALAHFYGENYLHRIETCYSFFHSHKQGE